jgi:DNA-binding GntR family transcriptional regulator
MIELRNIPTDHLELPGNHEELLDAIQSGDRERIRSSLEHHIRDGWYPK